MAVTEMTPETDTTETTSTAAAPVEGSLERLLGTGDHTALGRLWVGFALVLTSVAFIARALVGVDLVADGGLLEARAAMLGGSALGAAVFLGAVPLLVGVATLVVPLQVGSPTIAFPRAAALAFWSWLVSAAIFITSVAVDGGIGGADLDAALLGNAALGGLMVALGLAAVCIATTVVAHRPVGMGLARVPLFAWSMLVAASIWIVSLGSALAHVVVGHLDAGSAADLAENFAGGIAWLLRGPAVYMLAIPVLGVAADVVATTTGRPLVRYGVLQGLIGAFGVLSFGAWAIGDPAINTVVWALFALAVPLPVLGLLAALAESMRHGTVRLSAALIGSVLALVNLLGAAVVGLLMALDTAGQGSLFAFAPQDLIEAQATFVIAAAVTGGIAALAHWSTRFWGQVAPETTARAGIVLVDVGGGLLATVVLVQVLVEAGGRTANEVFGILGALGALLFALGALTALSSSLRAAREASEGTAVEDDRAHLTLEWQTPSPAVAAVRTAELPVISSPYPLLDQGDD